MKVTQILTKNMQNNGFTLVELMIVVVVIGILTMLAVPSYKQFILKGQRSEATTALLEASSKQTQYFMDNKTYASTLTLLGYTANPNNTEQGHYQISITAPTVACPIASCFALAAAPLSSQTADTCGTFTLTSTNTKSASTSNCW